MISPFYKLLIKHQTWNSVKTSWKNIGEIRKILFRYNLLTQAYECIIENRVGFINVTRQIWLADEVQDSQEQVPYSCANFFDAQLIDSKIVDLSEKPHKPSYNYSVMDLKNRIDAISKELEPILNDENTLLTMFQTEFSLYAVWLAVLALFFSVVAIIISIVSTANTAIK